MVTERNSIYVQFKITEEAQKKLSKKLYIFSVVMLVVGCVGLAAYLILAVVFENPPAWTEAFLAFAVPFGVGLVFLLSVRSQLKQVRKFSGAVNGYEFYSNKLIYEEWRGGEKLATTGVDYNFLTSAKQKRGFLLFYYALRASNFVIDKSSLTEAELNTIKKLLKMQIAENAETLQLSEYAGDVKL